MGINEADRTEDGHLLVHARLAAAWHFLCRGLTERGRQLAIELHTLGRERGDPEPAAQGEWILGMFDIIDQRYADALVLADERIRALTPYNREGGFIIMSIAQIGSGSVSEGMKLLADYRRRALANEFMHPS
jgi:hypothetical protein